MRRSWRLLRSLLPGRSAARLRPQRRPIRLRAENGADRFLVDRGIHRRFARGQGCALVCWHASLARSSPRDPQLLILVENLVSKEILAAQKFNCTSASGGCE